MGDFKRSGGSGGFRGGSRGGSGGGSRFGGGRPSFGGRGGGRDRGDVQMHRATCAECNNPCEVPFRPTGERPVYCSDCFGKSQGREPRESSSRNSFAPRESFSQVSASPVAKFDDKKIDELKRQIEEVGKKVERILNLLENTPKKVVAPVELPMNTPAFKKVADKKVVKPVAKKKAVSKKK